jgi:hypothetical protein
MELKITVEMGPMTVTADLEPPMSHRIRIAIAEMIKTTTTAALKIIQAEMMTATQEVTSIFPYPQLMIRTQTIKKVMTMKIIMPKIILLFMGHPSCLLCLSLALRS